MTEKYSKDEQNEARRRIEHLLDLNRFDGGFDKHGYKCSCERCKEIARLGKKLFNGRTKFTTNYHTTAGQNVKRTRQIRVLLQNKLDVNTIAQIIELPVEQIERIIVENQLEK